jgi:hypothetical protein
MFILYILVLLELIPFFVTMLIPSLCYGCTSIGRFHQYLNEKIMFSSFVWLLYLGDKNFKHKCNVKWCENIITPFNFEVGHNVPESKGGATDLDNLRPICSKCNKSMGDSYTIDEFSELSKRTTNLFECFRLCKTQDS